MAELRPSIFREGWLACLKELGTPTEHPTWTVAAPEVVLPDVTEVYSPLILPGFNEEEYMNQLTKEENEGVAKLDGADAGNKLGAGVGEEGAGNEG